MTGIDPWTAVELSVIVASWCAGIGFPVAVAAGWLLARVDFRGKTLVSAVLLSPLVLPPVVTGLLLLKLLGRNGLIGGWLAAIGMPIPFTLAGAVIAAFVVGLPLYVSAARTAFEAIDPRYEQVSMTLGMRPWRTFLRVTLPLAAPGLGAGALLAFARALGEFGATAVLAGNIEGETRTIALAVYTLLEHPAGREQMWTLVGVSVAISLLAIAGHEALIRWQQRRLEVHG